MQIVLAKKLACVLLVWGGDPGPCATEGIFYRMPRAQMSHFSVFIWIMADHFHYTRASR